MKLISFLLIITELLLSQKVRNQHQNPIVSETKHLLTITSSNKDTLFRAYDLYVSLMGDIYIADQVEDCIKIFNQNGKLIKKFGKTGSKPGEFNTIGEIAISENYIAVSDYISTRLQIFSKDFKHIRTIYAQGIVFDLAFDSDEFLWVGAFTGKKNKTLFKYSKESSKIIQIIPLKYSSGDQFKDIFFLAISKDGYVVVAYRVLNRIEVWDKSGKFIRDFQIPGLKSEADSKKISTGLFSSTRVPDGIIIGFCSVNDSGNIFLVGGSYSENPARDLYVMNILGEFLARITMPEKVWKFYMQDKTNIYVVSGKELNVVKKYLLR